MPDDVGLVPLLALGPTCWVHGAILLAFFAMTCALVRSALALEAVLSRLVHVVVCVLTVLPAIVLAAVLVYAASQHPGRAWANLGVAAAVFVAWYLGTILPRLVRPDADADARWLALGACIAFPVGVISALAFS